MLPEAEIIRIARDLLYNRAMVYYQDKPIGTLAAIPQKTHAYAVLRWMGIACWGTMANGRLGG